MIRGLPEVIAVGVKKIRSRGTNSEIQDIWVVDVPVATVEKVL